MSADNFSARLLGRQAGRCGDINPAAAELSADNITFEAHDQEARLVYARPYARHAARLLAWVTPSSTNCPTSPARPAA